MLSNETIKGAVRTLLRTVYEYPVYLDEVIDNFEKPCFFVEVNTSSSSGTKETIHRTLSLTITFYQETADEADKIAKADVLQRLFLPAFHVGDRYLTPSSISLDIAGTYTDVMTLDLTFNFYDDFTPDGGGENPGPLMENVDMNYIKE